MKQQQKAILIIVALILLALVINSNKHTFSIVEGNWFISSGKYNGVSSGNFKISPYLLDFVCVTTRGIITSYKIRTAPQGNYIESCTCTRYAADPSRSGKCIDESCSVILDEKYNASCWILKTNIGNFEYDTEKQINEYIVSKYIASAKAYSMEDEDTHVYSVDLYTFVNVKDGLVLDIERYNESILKIRYNNKLGYDFEGLIELDEITLLFLPASKRETIPLIFKNGSGEIDYNISSVKGNRKFIVRPFIALNEIDSKGNVLKKQYLVGNEYVYPKPVEKKETMLNEQNYVEQNYSEENIGEKTIEQNNTSYLVLAGIVIFFVYAIFKFFKK